LCDEGLISVNMDPLPVILQTTSLAETINEAANEDSGNAEDVFVHQSDVEMTEAQPQPPVALKNVVHTGMALFVSDLLETASLGNLPSVVPTVAKPAIQPINRTVNTVVNTVLPISMPAPRRRTANAAVQVVPHNLSLNKRTHLKQQAETAQANINKSIVRSTVLQKQIARVKELQEQMDEKLSAFTLPKKKQSKQGILNHAKHYMSGNALELFKMQVRMGGKSHHARRWTREDIKFASEFFTENQDAYTYLAGVMALPSMRSLFTHDIDFMDEDLMLPSIEEENRREKGKDLTTAPDQAELLKGVQEMLDIDIDKDLERLEKEQEKELVVDPSLQSLDDMGTNGVAAPSRLSDVVLNSKNTYVIDLTQIAAQQKNIAGTNKEPQKVVVYMTVPKPKKT